MAPLPDSTPLQPLLGHLTVSIAAGTLLLLCLLFHRPLAFLWRGLNSLAVEYNQQYMDEDDHGDQKLE